MALNKYGIGFEDVRGALANSNANTPKGNFSDAGRSWEVGANDQLFKAVNYAPLIVAYRNGSPVHISDVGSAVDSVEDIRNAGYLRRPAVRPRNRLPPARREHYRHRGSHPRRAAAASGRHSAVDQARRRHGPDHDDPRLRA